MPTSSGKDRSDPIVTAPSGAEGEATLVCKPLSTTPPPHRRDAVEPVSFAHRPAPPPGYDLLDRIGGGGVGEVYLAREHATDRLVALKFLRWTGDPELHARFQTEIRTLARLNHPSIVSIFGADFRRTEPYFAMEYVPGGSLNRWIETHGPAPVEEAVRLIEQAARAIEAAHAVDVLHRDLKPANLFLVPQGSFPQNEQTQSHAGADLSRYDIKIGDFGIAKRIDRTNGQTLLPTALGTPGYLAPEQISKRFGDAGPAVDIHGLGATLYHLLVGRAPFATGSSPDEVQQVLHAEPPRPGSIRPGIPAELEAIVMTCLAKNPRHRYTSAGALIRDLEAVRARQPVEAVFHPPRPSSARNVVRLVKCLVAIVVVAAVFALGRAATLPEPDTEIVSPADQLARELATGKPVTLIGETGLPMYSRSVRGPVSIGTGIDGTCTIRSQSYDLLELVPDPGWDRFQIRFEIRQQYKGPNVEQVGVYFGFQCVQTDERNLMEFMYSLTWVDTEQFHPLREPNKQKALLNLTGVLHRNMGKEHAAESFSNLHHRLMVGSLTFQTVKPSKPGLWRTVVLDISPDSVKVQWIDPDGAVQTIAKMSGDQVREQYRTFSMKRLRQGAGAAVVADWHPRMPIGLVIDFANASVRNVILTPQP